MEVAFSPFKPIGIQTQVFTLSLGGAEGVSPW